MLRQALAKTIASAFLVGMGAVFATACVVGLAALGSIWMKATQLTERHHLPAFELVLAMMFAFAVLLWVGKSVTAAGREDA